MKQLYILCMLTFLGMSDLSAIRHPLYYFRTSTFEETTNDDGVVSRKHQYVGVETTVLEQEYPDGSLLAQLRAAYEAKRMASESPAAGAAAAVGGKEGEATSCFIALETEPHFADLVRGINSESVVWLQYASVVVAFNIETIAESSKLTQEIARRNTSLFVFEAPTDPLKTKMFLLSNIALIYSLLHLHPTVSDAKKVILKGAFARFYGLIQSSWKKFSECGDEKCMFSLFDSVAEPIEGCLEVGPFLDSYQPPIMADFKRVAYVLYSAPDTGFAVDTGGALFTALAYTVNDTCRRLNLSATGMTGLAVGSSTSMRRPAARSAVLLPSEKRTGIESKIGEEVPPTEITATDPEPETPATVESFDDKKMMPVLEKSTKNGTPEKQGGCSVM